MFGLAGLRAVGGRKAGTGSYTSSPDFFAGGVRLPLCRNGETEGAAPPMRLAVPWAFVMSGRHYQRVIRDFGVPEWKDIMKSRAVATPLRTRPGAPGHMYVKSIRLPVFLLALAGGSHK